MAEKSQKVLYVVSDGRGETGKATLRAALVQFQGQPYEIIQHGHILTDGDVWKVVTQAAEHNAVIFYTLVTPETRRVMIDAATHWAVPVVDLLGPSLSALHDHFKRAPTAEPGLLYESGREEIDRLTAIDFTLEQDDGCHPEGLKNADVILAGLSRVGKSSTCFYLAYHGVKAANVPIIPGIDFPQELISVPKERVVALVVNPKRLQILREGRIQYLGVGETTDYTNPVHLQEEARATHRIITGMGWRFIDVSYLATEEIAKAVMHLRGIPSRSLR